MSKLLSQPQNIWGFSLGVNNILILLNYSNCILVLFIPAWNIALISGVFPLILLSNPIPSIIISARKVYWMFCSLKTNKASSPDGIPPRFLKEFADELAPAFCRPFCLILNSCTYPSSWKHALVQPVPKKGDHSNPSNYCPIALTLAVAKKKELKKRKT